MTYYMPKDDYAKLIEAIANIPPCALTGAVDLDAIKIALGEVGDVWPDTIQETKAP